MYVVVDPSGVVMRAGRTSNAGQLPAGYREVHVDNVQAGQLEQPGTKTLNPDGTITVAPPPPLPSPPDYTALRQRIVALAQSSVGVVVDQTTQAQRLALVACLLLRADAIDPVTLAIKPLNTWLYPP